MDIYQITTRCESEVSNHFAVQAHDEEDAKNLAKRLLMTNMEKILCIRKIPEELRDGKRLQEIVDENHDIDYLLCTGGKWPSMVFDSSSIEYYRQNN